jgi:hypothetical protein
VQAGKNDIKEIKLPGELGGAELENKISMLTDDTQLFNKYERYARYPCLHEPDIKKYF